MILDGAYWVVRHSCHVRIDEDRLVQVAGALDPTCLHLPDWRVPVVPSWRDKRLVDYTVTRA